MYIDHITRMWKNRIKTKINLAKVMFNNILFSEDLFSNQNSKDHVQRKISTLVNIGKHYALKIKKIIIKQM